MTSKEALELLYRNCPMTVVRENDGIYLYSEYLVEVIKQDLDRLEKFAQENASLRSENEELKEKHHETLKSWYELKKVIKILKDKLDIKLEVYRNGGCILNHKVIYNCMIPNERCLRYLEVEEYKLLKEILENE